ncbi:hypothetical protein LO872_000679 [Vibrio fluvialis]|nr:hypothetical protein [Vibrio fluvialis]
MAWTIEDALDESAIEHSETTFEGYSFWLKKIPIKITVVLSVNPQRGGFNFSLSHYIYTPTQSGVYRPSVSWGDDEAYALHLAVSAVTQHYDEAIKNGYEPSESWLIPNQ